MDRPSVTPEQPEVSMIESYTTPSLQTPDETTMALIQSRSKPELSMLESFTTPSSYTPDEITLAHLQSRSPTPPATPNPDRLGPSVTPEVIQRTESFSEDMRVADFGYANVSEATESPVEYDWSTPGYGYANVSEATESPVEYVRIETPPQSWSPQSAPDGSVTLLSIRRSCSGHEARARGRPLEAGSVRVDRAWPAPTADHFAVNRRESPRAYIATRAAGADHAHPRSKLGPSRGPRPGQLYRGPVPGMALPELAALCFCSR
ncbi:hypothetical protein CCM_09218 [Cordyceps militaris CM01]|uniref:Uncharacterized protein n=1 Tax=Cordyceps militaris (strain CM01) TaxID=983644 RepID=G3JTS8_CORMM|nr:uncharacterized protein CCM_09218 [Cordyceps militaris CM01]EGX88082.1 hypothetical protein CCM_09218 [Cordyceps militaris CM01]